MAYTTPDRRGPREPVSLDKPDLYFPNTSPFQQSEMQLVTDLLSKATKNAHGIDTTVLNFKNTPFFMYNEDLCAFAENEDHVKYGFGFPGHDVAYCTLYILYALSGVPDSDTRFIKYSREDTLKLAYRCAVTALRGTDRNTDSMGISFYIANALHAFIMNKEFFYIDYFDKNHSRKREKIDEYWGDCTLVPRDWISITGFFADEHELKPVDERKMQGDKKYYRNEILFRDPGRRPEESYGDMQQVKNYQRYYRNEKLNKNFMHVCKGDLLDEWDKAPQHLFKFTDKHNNQFLDLHGYYHEKVALPQFAIDCAFDVFENYPASKTFNYKTNEADEFVQEHVVKKYLEKHKVNNRTEFLKKSKAILAKLKQLQEDYPEEPDGDLEEMLEKSMIDPYYPAWMRSSSSDTTAINNDNRATIDVMFFKRGKDWEIFLNGGKKMGKLVVGTTVYTIYSYIYDKQHWGGHQNSIVLKQELKGNIWTIKAFIVDPSSYLHALDTKILKLIVLHLFDSRDVRFKIEIVRYSEKFGEQHSDFLTEMKYAEKRGECTFFNYMLIAFLLTHDPRRDISGIGLGSSKSCNPIMLYRRPKVVTFSNVSWLPFFGQMYMTFVANEPPVIDELGVDKYTEYAKSSYKLFLNLCDCVMYTKTEFLPKPSLTLEHCFTKMNCSVECTPIFISGNKENRFFFIIDLKEVKDTGSNLLTLSVGQASLVVDFEREDNRYKVFLPEDPTQEQPTLSGSKYYVVVFNYKAFFHKIDSFEPPTIFDFMLPEEEKAESDAVIVQFKNDDQPIFFLSTESTAEQFMPGEIRSNKSRRIFWHHGKYEFDFSYYKHGFDGGLQQNPNVPRVNYIERLTQPEYEAHAASVSFWTHSGIFLGNISDLNSFELTQNLSVDRAQKEFTIKHSGEEATSFSFFSCDASEELAIAVEQHKFIKREKVPRFSEYFLPVKILTITDQFVYDSAPNYASMNTFAEHFSVDEDMDKLCSVLDSSAGSWVGSDTSMLGEPVAFDDFLSSEAYKMSKPAAAKLGIFTVQTKIVDQELDSDEEKDSFPLESPSGAKAIGRNSVV